MSMQQAAKNKFYESATVLHSESSPHENLCP